MDTERDRKPVLRLAYVRPPRPRHVITIEPEPFGAVDVRVVPAPDGPGHDQEFSTYPAAVEYAERLSSATGWPVADAIGPAAA